MAFDLALLKYIKTKLKWLCQIGCTLHLKALCWSFVNCDLLGVHESPINTHIYTYIQKKTCLYNPLGNSFKKGNEKKGNTCGARTLIMYSF